jgi:membrane-bound lytic murein transglycosylase A
VIVHSPPGCIAWFLAAAVAVPIAACARQAPPASGQSVAGGFVYGPVARDFHELPGWGADDPAAALPALWNSCSVHAAKAPGTPIYYNGIEGTAADWAAICDASYAIDPRDPAAVRAYFETWFFPIAVDQGDLGKFTGYFAPELRGSWQRTAEYTVPLYRTPSNSADRRHTREAIAEGALENKGLELLWVDDPVDAFFLEIQGSGNVRMTDGSVVSLKFDGQNGRDYVAVGRVLVDAGIATLDEMSMDYIRGWMAANPGQAQALMNRNPSYVYFRIKDSTDVVGAHGVPLTGGRSLAVDADHYTLGVPIWLDIVDPTVPGGVLRRLVFAQDIGGAIRGSVRGDIYWGEGDAAGAAASAMNAEGRMYMLVPRATLDLAPG